MSSGFYHCCGEVWPRSYCYSSVGNWVFLLLFFLFILLFYLFLKQHYWDRIHVLWELYFLSFCFSDFQSDMVERIKWVDVSKGRPLTFSVKLVPRGNPPMNWSYLSTKWPVVNTHCISLKPGPGFLKKVGASHLRLVLVSKHSSHT